MSQNIEKNESFWKKTLVNLFLGLGLLFLTSTFVYVVTDFSKFKFSYSFTVTSIIVLWMIAYIIVFFLKPKIKTILVTIFSCLILLLMGIESTLPLEPLTPIVNRPKFVDGKFPKLTDTRSRLQVMEDFQKEGITIYPAIEPSNFFGEPPETLRVGNRVLFPLSGISNAKTLFDNESGEWQYFASDEHGFNNPKGLYVPGEVDILLLGGSYAQGMGVKQHENFAGVFREKYPGTLSLGMKGTGPLSHFAIFQEYGARLKPKVVVWFYYEGSEMATFKWELDQPQLKAYLKTAYHQNLFEFPRPVLDQMLKEWLVMEKKDFAKEIRDKVPWKKLRDRIRMTTKLQRMLTLYGFKHKKKEYAGLHPIWNHLSPTLRPDQNHLKILKYVEKRVESWGGKLYVVVVPTKKREKEGVRNPNYDYASTRNGQVVGIEAVKIPFIDLYPIILSHQDPMSLHRFRRWGHFTPDGYRFVADAIMERIGTNFR